MIRLTGPMIEGRDVKKTTWTALAVTGALALVGCSSSESSEPASAPTETATATDLPEGYSFDLPLGLSLGEETYVPAEEGELFESAPTYRRLVFGDPAVGDYAPLVQLPPGELTSRSVDFETLEEGVAFGARYYVERFIDSELLMQDYTREAEQAWFASLPLTADLREEVEGVVDQPFSENEAPATLSFGAPMFRADEEGEATEAGGVLYPEGGPRLANFEAALTDAQVNDEALVLTYEGTQTLLYIDDSAEAAGAVNAMEIKTDLTLGLWLEGGQWKVDGMTYNFNYSTEFDVD